MPGKVQRERRDRVVADKRPHHENVAMREINEAQNPYTMVYPKGEQGIRGPQGEAVDKLLKEFGQLRIDGFLILELTVNHLDYHG